MERRSHGQKSGGGECSGEVVGEMKIGEKYNFWYEWAGGGREVVACLRQNAGKMHKMQLPHGEKSGATCAKIVGVGGIAAGDGCEKKQ